jgi:acetyl-CoA acetyltransferase
MGMPVRELIDATAVVGVGFGPDKFARCTESSLVQYSVDACLNAVDDAGIDLKAIDGVFTWTKDAHTIQPEVMSSYLGLEELGAWGSTGTIAVGSLITAAQSVAAGLCDYALVYRAMTTEFGATGFTTTSTGVPTITPGT